jgi:hypothetical protein
VYIAAKTDYSTDPFTVHPSTLTVSAGTISGNEAFEGGGVYAEGDLTMSGGTISANTATAGGGGVYVFDAFNLSGGSITDNEAGNGGGVYAEGDLTMSGGTVSTNTATSNGGGVFVSGNGTFAKTGGIIYGNGTPDQNLANSGSSGAGQAVYYDGSSVTKYRDSTAGGGDPMSADGTTFSGFEDP